jgi:hypothetical protein
LLLDFFMSTNISPFIRRCKIDIHLPKMLYRYQFRMAYQLVAEADHTAGAFPGWGTESGD